MREPADAARARRGFVARREAQTDLGPLSWFELIPDAVAPTMPLTFSLLGRWAGTGRPSRLAATRGAWGMFLACAALAAALVYAGRPVPAVILGVLLAPWLEETVFRAGLHEALLRQPAWSCSLRVAAVALAFASLHVWHHGPAIACAVFVPALLLGADYERHRSLPRCVLLHASMNALALVTGLADPLRGL